MPLANKALALPLCVQAAALPQRYQSLAANLLQNLFLQGGCEHCVGCAVTFQQ